MTRANEQLPAESPAPVNVSTRLARRHRRGRFGLLRNDAGGVTAEFAIALPVVIIVLGIVVAGVMLSAQQAVLMSAAAEVARLEARGDTAAAGARLAALRPGASLERGSEGRLHCVILRSSPAAGPLTHLSLSARACAARVEDEQ